MSSIIRQYKHPILFYSLATFIPWMFWIIAGYISHLSPVTSINANLASVFGFIGLLVPMMAAFWLIYKDSDLKNDLFGRLINYITYHSNFYCDKRKGFFLHKGA